MKKIAMIVLFVMSFSMAERCGIMYETLLKISFIDSTLWWRDTYAFWGVGTVLENGEPSFTLEDGYNCEKGKYEKAFLDSNTFLHREKYNGYHTIDIVQIDKANHGLGDVFRDEFLHWQQCGMLNLTYEEADSLVSPLVVLMNGDYEYDPWYDFESDIFFVSGFGTISTPQQFVKWAKEACATTSVEHPQRTPANNIVYENGRAQIPEHLRGERYFIFDMNGRVLQKGFATETIDLPPTPSILKIGNETSALVK